VQFDKKPKLLLRRKKIWASFLCFSNKEVSSELRKDDLRKTKEKSKLKN